MLQQLFYQHVGRVLLITRVLGLVVLCAAVAACERPVRLAPLNADSRILAFGDSLTFGTGAEAEHSYPAQLSILTAVRVINAGVAGETSAAGLRRLAQLLRQHQPQLLILCHGGNDILRRMPHSDTLANLQAMIDMAQMQNIDVLLIGVPEFGIFLSTAEFYKQLAARNHIAIDDNTLGKILRQPALRSDHIHPNADGYKLLAQAIATLLTDAGALAQN